MAVGRSQRSPGYPTMSLVEAIAKIDMIYKEEYTHPVHRDVLVKRIGYGTWNGASSTAIATLHRYGLLEQAGNKEQYRVSDEAVTILLNRPERGRTIQKIAYMPSVFSELHQYYGDALPSNQTIKNYLIRKGYNEKIVDGIIGAYRDTIEFVNVETASSELEPIDEMESEVAMQTQPVKPTNSDPDSALKSGLPTSSLPEKGEKVWSFDLSEDCSIKMVLTGHVTKEALENLKAYIDISIKTAPKASVKQQLLFEQDIDHHENE